MAAYCAVPPDDPFAFSKAMFTALTAELAGLAAAGLTAFELEDLLGERGREVVRQLLQDHYELRASREEQQAREQRAPATGTDGVARTRLETGPISAIYYRRMMKSGASNSRNSSKSPPWRLTRV
jgi:hypothetical protein